MLDDKRIKEAEENVRDYLKDGLLRKAVLSNDVFDVYLKNSSESIELAKDIFKNNKSNLWVIVTSYYSMYYMANALLCNFGYKVGEKISHKVTADALIVFARNKIRTSLLDDLENAMDEAMDLASVKTDEMISDFEHERTKRSRFQYKMPEQAKERHAKTS